MTKQWTHKADSEVSVTFLRLCELSEASNDSEPFMLAAHLFRGCGHAKQLEVPLLSPRLALPSQCMPSRFGRRYLGQVAYRRRPRRPARPAASDLERPPLIDRPRVVAVRLVSYGRTSGRLDLPGWTRRLELRSSSSSKQASDRWLCSIARGSRT